MKTKILFLVTIIILSAVGTLFGALPAKAISWPPVQQTDNLSIISFNGEHNISVGNNDDMSWISLINNTDISNELSPTQRSFLELALSGGSVAVSQELQTPQQRVLIWASLEPNALLRYNFYPSQDMSKIQPHPDSNISNFLLEVQGNGTIRFRSLATPSPSWDEFPLAASANFFTPTYLYYSTYNIQYWDVPTNMQVPNPGVPPLPNQPPVSNVSDFAPEMHVQFATDWKATFVDSRFTTVDSVPFLCNEQFAPQLNFELWDITNEETKILDASYSASAVYEYQFTKKPTQQEFRIVAWYSCPDDDITFTESSTRDFLIDGQGNLLRRGLNTCIQPEWPFLIWEDCMFAMNEIMSTLAFNFHNPTNNAIATVSTQNPDNCYTLTTLDAWIYTPNQVICPAVPKPVRDAVTPFVLFVLASVVFMYISRAKASVIS